MSLFRRLFVIKNSTPDTAVQTQAPAGGSLRAEDIIMHQVIGNNLVDNAPTWKHAESSDDDLECMMRCCEAELETKKAAGYIAAPFYFERVAILSRKAKEYRREVEICERYINLVEAYYDQHGTRNVVDVRRGARYKKIVARLPKARELLAQQEGRA